MPATTNEGQIHGFRALKLENDWLEVSILPDLGGKIFDLIWKPTRRNFLWHNPRIAPQPYAIEANFDNYWCGGWDDAFPTCDACDFDGEHYPNLGELRSLKWSVRTLERVGGDAIIKLSVLGHISPVQAEKTVVLLGEAAVLDVRYVITNLGPMPLEFIWGTHPALAPSPKMILRVPAKTGIVGQASDPSLGAPGQRYSWPILETPAGRTDMSLTRGIDAKVSCGHYATDLEDGWYAVEDSETGRGFLLGFPKDLCPYLWMWLVYGGWRGYHHVIMEPWTSYPVNLAEASRQHTTRKIGAGEKFSVEVCATIYDRPQTWRDGLKLVS